MRKIKQNIKLFVIIFLRLFIKPKKNVVLLSGFYGEYSDNTKYIAEKLHEKNKNIEIYWALGAKGIKPKDIPPYINVIYTNTFKYMVYCNRAKILVDNYYGFFMAECPTKFLVKLKNNRQFNLSTWHGTPIKCIGADAKNSIIQGKIFSTTDLCIAGCTYTKEKLESSYISHLINPVEIKLTGTPRNDVLFNKDAEYIKSLKEKLGLPYDKKVVIYAPTFRDDVNKSGVNQIKSMNIKKLLDAMRVLAEGDWIFVFRVHHEVMDEIMKLGILSEYEGLVYNGNEHPDMGEYLCVSDCLITDYSSSLFDFALTLRPCFLYADDYEEYASKERGLYIDINSLPYKFSQNFEELVRSITSYDATIVSGKVKNFLGEIGNIEDGYASERIAEIIINKINE